MGCSSEAGKTGTSEDLSDAWFVGYTPMYSTAVWTGHPLSRDYTGFGGPTSGPVWRSYMEAAQGGDCPDFEVPTSLPDLTSFHGDYTASSSSSCSSSSYSCGYSSSYTPSGSGSDDSGDGNKGAYAPGVGQKPAPSPKPKPTPAPPAAPPPAAPPPPSGGTGTG
jgi:penicillin-binding protein 1A